MKKRFFTIFVMVVGVLTMLSIIACPPPATEEPAIETVKTPVITPDGGEGVSNFKVTITSATAGATIRYTVDGSEPTATSTLYDATADITPVFSEAGTVVKAKAFKDGMNASLVATSKGFIKVEPGVYLRGSMNGWGMSDRATFKFKDNYKTTGEFVYQNKDLTGDQAFKIVGGFVGWNDNASLCPTAKVAADVKGGDDDATADLQWSLPKDSTYGVYPTAGVGLPIDVAVKGGGQNIIYSVGAGAVYKLIISDLSLDYATGLFIGENGAPAYDENIGLAKLRLESTNVGTFPPPYFNALKWYFRGGLTSWGADDTNLMSLSSDAGSIWEATSDLIAGDYGFTIATEDWSKRWAGSTTYGYGESIPEANKVALDTTADMHYQTTDSNMQVTIVNPGIYTVRVQYDGEGIFNTTANVKVKIVSPK